MEGIGFAKDGYGLGEECWDDVVMNEGSAYA